MSPGTAATVMRMKNVTQSTWSASQPLPDDMIVRENAMNDDSNAYCVAV